MPSRAMVVVGGGSSSRFGKEKLLATINGAPLVTHTISAVLPQVDRCVLVTRSDLVAAFEELGLGVEVVPGGSTRTMSEVAGLAVLTGEYELIGIHDAARPVVGAALIDLLFATAETVGGAVPVVKPDRVLVDRRRLTVIDDVVKAQTPQVFRGPDLTAAYAAATQSGFEGKDTVEIVQRFSDLEIEAVEGSVDNVKVTYPSDLDTVRSLLSGPSHT